jgi:hypothetical protein
VPEPFPFSIADEARDLFRSVGLFLIMDYRPNYTLNNIQVGIRKLELCAINAETEFSGSLLRDYVEFPASGGWFTLVGNLLSKTDRKSTTIQHVSERALSTHRTMRKPVSFPHRRMPITVAAITNSVLSHVWVFIMDPKIVAQKTSPIVVTGPAIRS